MNISIEYKMWKIIVVIFFLFGIVYCGGFNKEKYKGK